MKSARTAPPGDNRATWATAFEAAPLTKPPALRGVSDLRLKLSIFSRFDSFVTYFVTYPLPAEVREGLKSRSLGFRLNMRVTLQHSRTHMPGDVHDYPIQRPCFTLG
jgi:hypothetical protein